MATQRGLEANQEQNYEQIIRDTRTLGQRMADFLKQPRGVTYLLIAFSVSSFILSYFADIFFLANIILFLYCFFQKTKLPFRMPLWADVKDYNDIRSGQHKPHVGQGIYYFGNEKKDLDELWFYNEDMRTHVLMFG